MARPVSIRRETILEAARTMFMEHGYQAGTAGIARMAGVSEGSLFKHFKTKSDLFLAAMDVRSGRQSWQKRLDEVAGTGDIRETLILAGGQIQQRIRLILPRLMMITSSGITISKHDPHPGEKPPPLQHVEIIERYFRKEIKAGRLVLDSPRTQAHVFIGALSHYAWCETVFGYRPASPARYLRSVVNLILKDALVTGGGRPVAKRDREGVTGQGAWHRPGGRVAVRKETRTK